ncbi:MAG TPA: glycerol-3-phosphate 1-O-acyltransferase PlsY [Bacteroidales bacterium]|jgi:glycerol-3-phosphate acyltransferase PlsY|nr:glycerol-3-phosphate 1-O-acyltransferase PlsY [Bacteroidales bacterium]
MNEYLLLIAGGVVAYLMGSFSSAVWIGKWFYNTDVREHGSGNAGATNTIRVLGTRAGVIVMAIDIVKAWGAVMLAHLFAIDTWTEAQLVDYKIVVGSLAVLGHVFPVFTGFKGGKGVASLVGVIIALFSPYIFLLVLAWFLTVFILTRYVSLASVTASIFFAVLAIFIFHEQNTYLIILAALIAVFVPLTHHKNIKRLLKGEENKLSFAKKQKNGK